MITKDLEHAHVFKLYVLPVCITSGLACQIIYVCVFSIAGLYLYTSSYIKVRSDSVFLHILFYYPMYCMTDYRIIKIYLYK